MTSHAGSGGCHHTCYDDDDYYYYYYCDCYCYYLLLHTPVAVAITPRVKNQAITLLSIFLTNTDRFKTSTNVLLAVTTDAHTHTGNN